MRVDLPQDRCACEPPVRTQGSVLCQRCGANLPRHGERVYVYAGLVERGPRYRHVEGWSLNGNTYPWLTQREARQEAAQCGARAVFVRTADPTKQKG